MTLPKPFTFCWDELVSTDPSAVDNCDQLCERAPRLGAKVTVPPTDIPSVGRFACWLDPMKLVWLVVLAACGSSAPQPRHAHEHHLGDHRFAKADDWVPMFDDPQRDEWQKPDRVVQLLALSPGMVVADIGAGTGYFEQRLATAVGSSGAVIAIDVEPDMVRYLRERALREKTPNVEARLGAPDDPKLAAPIDRALIVDTWHHIGDRVAYAKKLGAALEPGGFVLIVDFTLETKRGPPVDHRLDPAKVIAEAEQAGLRAAIVEEDLPDQYVVKLSK